MLYVGVDPGVSGAIAFLYPRAPVVIDMPTLQIKTGKKTKNMLDAATLATILGQDIMPMHVYVEDVHPMPKEGTVSSFSFGVSNGIIIGILAAYKIPYTKVTPQRWKKLMLDGMPKDKGASIARALQLFPSLSNQLITKRGAKKDGRAEALLIAVYAKRMEGSPTPEEDPSVLQLSDWA